MPFLAGRGQASRGFFGGGTTPDAPTLGTLTTSISSPNTVSTPSMTQDANNANFSWSSPGAGGVTIGIPFTAPAFNGGLAITDYEYSTDNGSTWKSAGTTTSPISITTVSGSSANLEAGASPGYTVKLRAVNGLGSGTASAGSVRTTLAAVTSYTIRVYNNRGTETLTETITGNTTGSYSRSHYRIAADWSVTVAALNSNGTGTFSAESAAATGWSLTSCTNYDATGCDSCGTKSIVCSQWTRSALLPGAGDSGPCDVSCGSPSICSSSWGTWNDFAIDTVYEVAGGISTYAIFDSLYDGGWVYCTVSGSTEPYYEAGGCSNSWPGPNYVERCPLTGNLRVGGGNVCRPFIGGL